MSHEPGDFDYANDLRRSAEALLERAVEQPACGCRIEWSWFWTPGSDWPRTVQVVRLLGCPQHAAPSPIVEQFARAVEQALRERLESAHASGEGPPCSYY
jgi:hypothetical protein